MDTLYAGIDLGGTNIKGVLGTADGNVVVQRSIPTEAHTGPEGVLARIGDLVDALSAEAGKRPAAIGMGCPGLVDSPNGITRFFPNLPTNWRDVPVADILLESTGLPAYLLNDVRLATLGEKNFGRGKDVADMVLFAIGTGIGGGVVLDGKLRLGPLGAAGELGHLTILPDGPRCGCGNRGCLETLASGPAIGARGVRLMRSGLAPKLHTLTEGNTQAVTPETMLAAAEAGDTLVKEALQEAARYIGIGVSFMVVTLHPELVVIGGGVAHLGDLLFDTVRATVADRVGMFPTDTIRIEPAQLGSQAGALGGLALASQSINT